MKECDLVLGGGGSLLPAIAAAAYGVAARRAVRRVAGTSAGSIAAAALAFDISPAQARGFCAEYLADDRLLDASLWPLDRWGIFTGDALHRAIRKVLPGRMGDARIPLHVVVCDLWTRAPLVITSHDHPDVLVADAVRASCSIPVFFKAWRIAPKWGSRTFVDGGVAMNFAMDLFDDVEDRETIGVRVRRGTEGDVRPVRGLGDFAAALAGLFFWSADNAHLSHKNTARAIDIVTGFDGLDFDLSEGEVLARWESGRVAAVGAFEERARS